MNRTDRLIAIVLLLRSRSKLTARQLAEIFEVSIRTIYRDVDALCQAGIPIAAEMGPEGGYSLLGLKDCISAIMTEMEKPSPIEASIREGTIFREISTQAAKFAAGRWKW